MDADDLELFARSIGGAVAAATGGALDSTLAELGWADALADDPRAAIAVLFERQGGANVTSAALDHVLADSLGLDLTPTATFVLPAIGRWDPPGTRAGADLAVDGVASAALAHREDALVVAAADDGTTTVVTVPTASLSTRPVEGVDPALGLVQVTADVAGAGAGAAVDAERWAAAVARARLALAHELVGVSRRMLELAREHALERVQFGVPISSFQAVRHRLAETLVAIETADAVLEAAWIDGTPETAAMAKAMAGRSARTAARHAQQVLAGIGFTTEHDLHLHIRRLLVLDPLLGASIALTRAFGTDLAATRTLPPLLPL